MSAKQKIFLRTEQDMRGIGIRGAAAQGIVSMLMVTGVAVLAQFNISSPASQWSLIGIGMCMVVLLQILHITRRFDSAAYLFAGGICLLLMAWKYSEVIQGTFVTINQLIMIWNVRFDKSVALLSVNSGTGGNVLYFWILMTILMAVVADLLVVRRLLLSATLVNLALIWFAGAMGLDGSGMVLLLFFSGWLGCLVLQGTGNGTVWKHLFCCLASAACLGIVCALFLSESHLWQTAAFKEAVEEQVHRWRYGENSLPEGDLTKESTLLADDEVSLTVSQDVVQDLYLRGYVATEYTGTSWETMPKVKYSGEQSGLLAWMSSKGLAAQSQFASFESEVDDGELATARVSVKNTGASREYVYVPATLSQMVSGDYYQEMDWQLKSEGLRGETEYAFDCVAGVQPAEQLPPEEALTDDLGQAEGVYRNFVYENYLGISDSMKALMGEVFYEDMDWEDGNNDLYTITSRIRTVLSAKEIYREEPEKESGGKDKIYQFLMESHAGNAMSFASAAVMAFRAAKIPARYVEGYYLSAEDVRRSEGQEIELTGADIHVWPEVYISGYGWLPVEVTPGFYSRPQRGANLVTLPVGEEGSHGDDMIPVPKAGGGSVGEGDEKDHDGVSAMQVLSAILLGLYGMLLLFLLLELQRAVRVAYRKRKLEREAGAGVIAYTFRWITRVLRAVRVEGDMKEPMKRGESVQQQLSPVTSFAYCKTIRLMQRVHFGGKVLSRADRRAVRVFVQDMEQAARKKKKGFGGAILYRYWYCI